MDSSLSPEAIAFATRIYDAARTGQTEIFEQALPAGLPVNMMNEKGDSLIMLASYHGHTPLVTLLLRHGANANSLNDRGQSPLAGAVFKGESEVVEALLAGGADPDYGTPSAMEAIVLFRQEEQWRGKFEAAPGKGKAVAPLPAATV